MDFDSAIAAHGEWKHKLAKYLQKPDRSLDPGKVGRDDACPLGQWIHGEAGKRFATLPELTVLRAEHARFHREAASIVKRADAGENVSGLVALGGTSPFALASSSVVQAILQMKKSVPAAR